MQGDLCAFFVSLSDEQDKVSHFLSDGQDKDRRTHLLTLSQASPNGDDRKNGDPISTRPDVMAIARQATETIGQP